MDSLLVLSYYALFLLLSLHGLHRASQVWRVLRAGRKAPGLPPLDHADRIPAEDLPPVTIQLPIFNERYVADRLLRAAAALRWPRERLEIQVLDDSTDETSEILAAGVAELQDRGIDVVHIRRKDRSGYKAGALAAGLAGGDDYPAAKGDFVAIFDADFLPAPDFLERCMPSLLADEGLALVQARWDHFNRGHSLLTRVQAVLLDAHFAVEHEARQRAKQFLNFNGTAGIWRKSAIAAAGGWSHDTLTEDLDLSFRAQLAGLRILYLHDVAVRSELPAEINAFKGQQRRWAKGSTETARKLLGELWRNKSLRLSAKIEGSFHLLNNTTYLLLFVVSCLVLPVTMLLTEQGAETKLLLDRYLLAFGILPVLVFFLVGQVRTGQPMWKSLLLLPFAVAIGIGLAVNNSVAVLEALLGKKSPFVRTPKYRLAEDQESWIGKTYLAARGPLPLIEIALGVLAYLAFDRAMQTECYALAAFQGLFALGYGYVGLSSAVPALAERLRIRGLARRSPSKLRVARPLRANS